MKYAFLVETEFLKHQQIYTLLKIIEAARAKGNEILGIFFFSTGVLNIKKDVILGKSTRNIPEDLASLDVKIYACQTWADNFGVRPENVIDCATICGLGEFSDLTAEADKLIAFGAHA